MKFSPSKIFIYALISTILIFGFMKSNISPKEKIIDPIIARLLATKSAEEMTHELCSKSSSDLENFYKENSPDYTFNPDSEDKFLNDLIIKLANGSSLDISSNELVDYSKDSGLLIVVIILLVILFLLWIPYIICVCTKSCCCIPDSCLDKKMNCFLIVALVLSVAVAICCFIGYDQNTDILHGIFGLGCSVLKIENHLVHGDEYTKEIPYWIGLTPIVDKFLSTKVQLQKISDNSHSIETKKINITNLWEKINNNLTNEYSAKESKTISNPNPNDDKIKPSYIANYGPINETETSLGSIYRESEIYKSLSIELISNIIEVINIRNSELDETKKGIERLSEELNNSVTKIEDAIVSTIGEYYKYFDDVDSYVRKTMNILFSLNLAIVVFRIVV